MPPFKVAPKDNRTPEEIAIQNAINSQYNLCTPLFNAENVRITDPVTRRDSTYKVGSADLQDRLITLVGIGLGPKLQKEFAQFESEISPKWAEASRQLHLAFVQSDY